VNYIDRARELRQEAERELECLAGARQASELARAALREGPEGPLTGLRQKVTGGPGTSAQCLMPNITLEREHLAQADKHIALARENIARAENSSSESQDAADHLLGLKEALAAFEGHRALILQTIGRVRDGSLPDRTAG